MRLLIDNDYFRRKLFRQAHGHNTHTPDRPFYWLQALAREDGAWTHIYLDHDLGLDTDNGETLARYLAGEKRHTGTPVFIHSANAAGSQRMYDILKDTHNVQQVTWAEVIGEDEQEQQP